MPGIVPALGIVFLIIVMLFNAYRPPLVIILTIPFAFIGITFGLLAFNSPFGFLALLGAMSLAAMFLSLLKFVGQASLVDDAMLPS